MTDIHEYAELGDRDGVLRELTEGAFVDDLDGKGRTPLSRAVRGRGPTDEVVRLLLERGADIRWISPSGYSLLVDVMYARNDRDDLVSLIDYLIRMGAATAHETRHGETPLSVASWFGGSTP